MMSDPSFADLIPVGQFMTTIITFGGLAWWLSQRFTEMRNEVYSKIENSADRITNKIEYHERHDDTRFAQLQNDITAIRIRNAAMDARMIIIEDATETEDPRSHATHGTTSRT